MEDGHVDRGGDGAVLAVYLLQVLLGLRGGNRHKKGLVEPLADIVVPAQHSVMHRMLAISSSVAVLLLASAEDDAAAQKARPAAGFKSVEVARFDEPWAMAFLPDGRLLVTEKRGAIKLMSRDGKVGTVAGAPRVDYGGQGGLVRLDHIRDSPDGGARGGMARRHRGQVPIRRRRTC